VIRIEAMVLALLLLWGAPLAAQRVSRRVFAQVLDASGVPITDLTAADFTVAEDGVSRPVLRAVLDPPMRIVLLVDTSSLTAPIINHFRSGLAAFVEAVPGTPEIGLVTMGGPIRIRVQPMADRAKLAGVVQGLAPDGGGNTFADTLFETDRRLLWPKPANNAWPVLVVLMTDSGQDARSLDVDEFNRFVDDFVARGGSAHALVVRETTFGPLSEIAQNLAGNAGGIYEPIAASTAVADHMRSIGDRVAADRTAMAGKYELEYQSDVTAAGSAVSVQVTRVGARVRASARRPF
jgi:hypothetical protein